MGLEEELEEAEKHAKTGDTETSILGMVAKILRVKDAAAAAAIHAIHQLERARYAFDKTTLYDWFSLSDAPEPSGELRDLIARAARIYMLTAVVQQAIAKKCTMYVAIKAVVQNEKDVCLGCPIQMQCVTENLSTKEQCYVGHGPRHFVEMVPLRLENKKVVAEMRQPGGVRTIPLWKLAEDGMIQDVW